MFQSQRSFRFLTWAFVILLGSFILTPIGPVPIVTNAVLQTILGIAAVVIGVIGLNNIYRNSGDPTPLPWKITNILFIFATVTAVIYGIAFTVPRDVETISSNAILMSALAAVPVIVGLGGILSEFSQRRAAT